MSHRKEFAASIIAEMKAQARICNEHLRQAKVVGERITALVDLAELYLPRAAEMDATAEWERRARLALRHDIAQAASRFLRAVETPAEATPNQKYTTVFDTTIGTINTIAVRDEFTEIAPAADTGQDADPQATLDAPPVEAAPEEGGDLVEAQPSTVAGEIPARPDMQSGADASGAESPSVDDETAGDVVKASPAADTSEGASLASPSPGLAPAFHSQSDAGLPKAPPRLPSDDVLDLWANTKKTLDLIAIECGVTPREAERAIKRAERLGDSRATARAKTSSHRTVNNRVTTTLALIAKSMQRDTPASPSGFSKPPAPAPMAPKNFRRAITLQETKLGDVSEGVVVIDFTGGKVIGYRGMWTPNSPEIIKTIDKLNDGKCYSIEMLAKAGGWAKPETLARSVTTIIEHMRDIGVEVTNLPHIGLHMKRVERP